MGKGVGGGGGGVGGGTVKRQTLKVFSLKEGRVVSVGRRAGLMNFSHPGENHCEEVFNCFSSQAHQITALLSAGYKLMGIL